MQESTMRQRLSKLWNEPTLTRLMRDKCGATAIEYGLIAAGMSVAIIAVVNGLGTVSQKFDSIWKAVFGG